jgi:F5/8 type C domain/Dolichyl-phosphate-mannose-protein mannosyltransferase
MARYGTIILILIPLSLSAFIHLWNPIGFPALGQDEGHYMRRAMNILEGGSPQEGLSPEELEFRGESRYDHPYFGQLFLAGVFKLIGFPEIVNPSLGDGDSIEMLYSVPRILMGLLAVADTFLVFKIAERLYNKNVALISSILFAVMPITWLLRLILLDSILLPFLLLSILFALYTKDATIKNQHKKIIVLTFFSGVSLGLAVFTKVPVFTMIPLVAFLIYSNSRSDVKFDNPVVSRKRRLGRIGLWFIPVFLIPSIWPAYAMSVGEFDKWTDGVLHQATERGDAGKSFFVTVSIIFELDPVFTGLAILAIIYAAVKRNIILLLWLVPIQVFFLITGFVSQFHFSPVFPGYCIAAGFLIVNMINKIPKKQALRGIIPLAAIASITIFGLLMSLMLITTNVGAFHFDSARAVANYVKNNSDNVTIITGPYYSWVFKHVFDIDGVFEKHRPLDQSDISNNIIMTSNFKKDEFKIFQTNSEKRLLEVSNVNENNATSNSKLSNIIDGENSTKWVSDNQNSWILIDLGSEKSICEVKVNWFTSYQKPHNFTISVSPDGEEFADAYSGNIPTKSTTDKIYNLTNNVAGRFIRIDYDRIMEGGYLTIGDINAFTTREGNVGASSCEKELSLKTVADESTYDSSYKYEHAIAPSLPIFKFLNNSTVVGAFVGEKEKYDTSKYPYNNLDYNSGGGRVDIRSNFNP